MQLFYKNMQLFKKICTYFLKYGVILISYGVILTCQKYATIMHLCKLDSLKELV